MFSTALWFILRAIKEAIKNPKKKEEMREVLLQLRDAIDELYQPLPPVHRPTDDEDGGFGPRERP